MPGSVRFQARETENIPAVFNKKGPQQDEELTGSLGGQEEWDESQNTTGLANPREP